jgi:uncharacterized protein (UPF0332 family)
VTAETEALIKFRLEQAEHTLHGATVMLEAGERYGVNRQIYFAMFYCALALLASKQLQSAKHAGVISLIHKEFVHTGLFPPEVAALLNKAFEQRQKYDYRPVEPPTMERLKELLEEARSFLTATKLFLAKQ